MCCRSGSAVGQYFYFMGLQLASPSMARATTNLAPGITFAIAAVIGYSSSSCHGSCVAVYRRGGLGQSTLAVRFLAAYFGPTCNDK